jgi:class 3 adenylate cyclase/tetratricopeptide (TPR) repeat protein
VFSDLKGSTALGEQLDPEALHEVKDRYFSSMAGEITRHGGKIEKYIGDAIMAVFGLPRAHQDDALRAVRAAHGMQVALHRLNEDLLRAYGVSLAARTGVNTGEVVANVDPNADQKLATGDAVNVAARLEQAAPAMEVLVGVTTYELVRSWVEVEEVEPLELKGKSERVPAYRLVTIRDVGTGSTAGLEAPLVGRDAEVARLQATLEDALHVRRCRMVTVVGEAGVGKSRLVHEFVSWAGDRAQVLWGRCLPYGDGITFWPLVEVVRQAANILQDDPPEAALEKIRLLLAGSDVLEEVAERVASAIGLSEAYFPVAEIFWAARKLLETLAERQPLVVVVDDIHSSEATFLEFLEHILEASTTAPILVVCSSRTSLLDRHPEWGDSPGASRLILAPLTDADAEQIIDRLLGNVGLDVHVRARIVAAAEGNPLFVEQMVSMLVDKGLVGRDGPAGGRRPASSALAIPPTIQALLTERLDDLTREERSVIEPAAVIGPVFPEPAVEELVPSVVQPAVTSHLEALDRKQFVRPEPHTAGDDPAFRFRHLMIRDATYGSLLKRARAQLHERFVTWAERVNRERGREREFEEILGYHLEQAFRYRTELGSLDDETRSLGARGAQKLASAGRRAFARGDMPAAANLLGRAAALLDPADPVGIELGIDRAEALVEGGLFADALTGVEEAEEQATRIGDERLAARVQLARLGHELFGGELSDVNRAIDTAHQAIATFESGGDPAGLARAWRFLMLIHGTLGRYEDAADAARNVLDHARQADDERLATRGAIGYAAAALRGTTPVSEALPECSRLIEEVSGDQKAEGVILGVLAQLHAMKGDFEPARELYQRGRAMLVDLGASINAASTSIEASRVEILAGDPGAAERELRRDHDALEAMGERYYRSTVAGLLGQALVALDRLDEAREFGDIAEQLADPDDALSQVLWRSVRARVLAASGAHDEAVGLAQAAASIADGTVDLDLRGDAHAELGEILAAAGRPEEAAASWTEAESLYESKEDSVLAERVRLRRGSAA